MGEREAAGRGRRFLERTRRLNRDPRLVAAARRYREWALGDGEHLDRLSTARGRAPDVAARRLAGLREDAPGAAGEVGMAALQAWQRVAERQDRGRGRVDVAVMFTDLVGFSSWALEAGDGAAVRLLREVGEAIEPPVLERRGEVVKRLGDGLMAAFWDPESAAEAAFQAARRVEPIEVGGYRPELRTGIHLGRPRRIGGDYFGADVNIAARLADAARPGEILLSDAALERLDPGTVTARRRRFRAKGAPREMEAYSVRPAGSA